MNLVEQAKKDLAVTLEDKENGFGVDIELTDENNNLYYATGQTTDIGFFIDPGTGVGVAGRTAEVSFRLSTFCVQSGGKLPTHGWIVSYQNKIFSIQEPIIDRKLDIIKLTLGLLRDGC